MSLFKIYHNPSCSKSREALRILENHKKEITIIKYLETPIKKSELEEICQKLGCNILDIIRTQEPIFQALNLDLNNADKLFEAVVKHPVLLQRPIVISGQRAAVGRPIENILALLN